MVVLEAERTREAEVGAVWHYQCGENRFQLKLTKFEMIGTTNCARIELFVNNKSEVAEHIAVTKDAVLRSPVARSRIPDRRTPPSLSISVLRSSLADAPRAVGKREG